MNVICTYISTYIHTYVYVRFHFIYVDRYLFIYFAVNNSNDVEAVSKAFHCLVLERELLHWEPCIWLGFRGTIADQEQHTLCRWRFGKLGTSKNEQHYPLPSHIIDSGATKNQMPHSPSVLLSGLYIGFTRLVISTFFCLLEFAVYLAASCRTVEHS